jgi:hypothetical protein
VFDCVGAYDECDVCNGPGLNDDGCCGTDTTDCNDECGGNAVEDECGVCNNDPTDDNVSCTGCMDTEASNYDAFATIPGDCEFSAFTLPNVSQSLAAYFFSDVTIDGVSADVGIDWIYAFKGDVCVGGRVWEGSDVELIVYGDMLSNFGFTEGYLLDGDVPTFKVVDFDSAEDDSGVAYDLECWNIAIKQISLSKTKIR